MCPDYVACRQQMREITRVLRDAKAARQQAGACGQQLQVSVCLPRPHLDSPGEAINAKSNARTCKRCPRLDLGKSLVCETVLDKLGSIRDCSKFTRRSADSCRTR